MSWRSGCISVGFIVKLHAQFAESEKLEAAIKANLKGLVYGG